MQNLHKDNALFTWVLWVYGGTLTSFCGTNGGIATVGTGFHFGADATNFVVRVVNSTTPALNITSTAVAPTADSRWHMVGVSINEATAAGIIHMDGTNEAFSATYSSPSSGNASQTLQIAARGNAANPTPNGNRFAAVMAWEGRALNASDPIALYQATRVRFGV